MKENERKEYLELAKKSGFSYCGVTEKNRLRFYEEVRAMCAADKCHNYDKQWVCPPACGTLEDMWMQTKMFTHCIVVQSVGELEDSFDVESMMRIETEHKNRFLRYAEALAQKQTAMLPMGTGGCTRCSSCTYPDAPCRFPAQAIPSMEAYGLIVTEVCKSAGISYYYGPRTMAFTSCILIGKQIE